MIWRRFRDEDLMACLNADPAHIGDELVGRARAVAAWKKLIGYRSFNAAVIEHDQAAPGQPIAGFGAAICVSPTFADDEIANPRPGLNARLIASIDAGQPVVLDDAELRARNTRGGLDLVVLCGYVRTTMPEDAGLEARMVLASTLVTLWAGYRLNRLVGEPIGPADRSFTEDSRAWTIACDFDMRGNGVPDPLWGRGRALATMTRESVLTVPGTVAHLLFHHREPVLGLRDSDQELLNAALIGLTDEELARELKLNLPAVKRRWLSLFNRIADSRADIFPYDVSFHTKNTGRRATRGRQKRHHLLAYLRQHPEELRPVRHRRPAPERRASRDGRLS